jgi:hypothetical protein
VHPHAQAIVALCEGAAANSLCRFEESLRRCQEAERILRERCRAVTWEIDTAQYIAGLSRMCLGRFDELCQLAPQQIREAKDRGDRYAETLLRLSVGFWPSLLAGELESVVADMDEAERGWQAVGFTSQAFVKFVSLGNVYLFAAPERAFDELTVALRGLERATISRVPWLRVMMNVLMAQAALSSAVFDRLRAEAMRARVRRAVSRLRREALPFAAPYARLLQGALARLEGDTARAISELHEAQAGFAGLDMGLYAHAASYREGQLLGGAQGQMLVERSLGWVRSMGIAADHQLLGAAAPGFPV